MGTSAVSSNKRPDARHAPPFIFGAQGGASMPTNPARRKMKEEYREALARGGMIDQENFEYWHLLQEERANRLAKRIYALCKKHNVAKSIRMIGTVKKGEEKLIKLLNRAYLRWVFNPYAGTGDSWKDDKIDEVLLSLFAPGLSGFFAGLLPVVARTKFTGRSCCTGKISNEMFLKVVSAYLEGKTCPTFKTSEFRGD